MCTSTRLQFAVTDIATEVVVASQKRPIIHGIEHFIYQEMLQTQTQT